MTRYIFILILACQISVLSAQNRARDYDINVGVLQPGSFNAITDVKGVKVGHATLIEGDSVRTGVTAILPHAGNIFQEKVPGAIYVGNGFGKLAGSTQVQELGNIETPIILTNTLSVPTAMNAVIGYTLNIPENDNVRSVNALVGETNDGWLNDIRGRHVKEFHVLEAIRNAQTGVVKEGNIGAGTGTICFGYKGGIGTASRKLPDDLGGYTVGVLVQSNFGGVLQIDGAMVGEKLQNFYYADKVLNESDGSCMIVVATDAPLSSRNLERLAKRAMLGLARTGGIASNGSGDYVIAFSTEESLRVPYNSKGKLLKKEVLHNDEVTPLFLAVIEATEEAIINSLFAAETMMGRDNHTINKIPVNEVLRIIKERP